MRGWRARWRGGKRWRRRRHRGKNVRFRAVGLWGRTAGATFSQACCRVFLMSWCSAGAYSCRVTTADSMRVRHCHRGFATRAHQGERVISCAVMAYFIMITILRSSIYC